LRDVDGEIRGLRLGAALLAAATLVAVFFYAPAWTPMHRDDGAFAYMGRQLLRGVLPYRDVWDHKPPGIYLVNALGVAIGGDGRWGIWLLSALAATATVALSTCVLWSSLGVPWGPLCAVLGALVMVDPKLYEENGNLTELYGLALQWMTLWAVSRGGERRLGSLLLAGLAAGAAVTFKPTTSAIAIASVIYLASAAQAGRWRRLGTFLLGAAVVPGLTVAWLGAVGALSAALDCVVTYNRAYASADFAGALWRAVERCVDKDPINVLGVLTLASLLIRMPRSAVQSAAERVALLALPFELLWLALQGRFYGHYFLTLLPVLTIRSAVALRVLAGRLGMRRAPQGVLGLALVVVFVVRLGMHMQHQSVWRRSEAAWQAAAVHAVQTQSHPGEPVLVWGAELGVNFLAMRDAPTRYAYAFPLFMPGYTTLATWQEFVADLQRRPPALIVDASARANWPTPVMVSLDAIVAGETALMPSAARAEVVGFLLRYRKQTTPEGIELWVRAPPASLELSQLSSGWPARRRS